MEHDYEGAKQRIKDLKEERAVSDEVAATDKERIRELERKNDTLNQELKLQKDVILNKLKEVAPHARINSIYDGVDVIQRLANRGAPESPTIGDLRGELSDLRAQLREANNRALRNQEWGGKEKSKRMSVYCKGIKALGGGNVFYKNLGEGALQHRFNVLTDAFTERWMNLERIERIAANRGIDLGHNYAPGINGVLNSLANQGHFIKQ